MTLWQAVILGAVQGLGEFLPISSSAHLVIVPWLFRFSDPGLTFDVALHFGTLIALVAYFYKDWFRLLKAAFTSLTKKRVNYSSEEKLFWYLVLASIPGAVFGYLLEKQAETIFRSPLLIALMMTVMGIFLLAADQASRKNKDLQQVSFLDSILIGLSQAMALIPGVSRSGITITTGLSRGLTRTAAARFSFLLATPITAGAALLKAKAFFHAGINREALVGIAVSTFFGFLSIKYMLAYLQKYTYRVFVVYRFLFSLVVVVVYFLFR
jgi:undecaprenyl-diphosphatase